MFFIECHFYIWKYDIIRKITICNHIAIADSDKAHQWMKALREGVLPWSHRLLKKIIVS